MELVKTIWRETSTEDKTRKKGLVLLIYLQ